MEKLIPVAHQRPWHFLTRTGKYPTSDESMGSAKHGEPTTVITDSGFKNSLAKLSLSELRKQAARQGIDNAGKLSKAKLIERLLTS
ncbi:MULTISPECIES: Rho termination factor N-terminal domain-containing protein [Synechococcaceae]|uniref:Rho termination factor N-terminal domain-containing protein n=1 Tax=Synechococcaceae TaxID=1890426 RepID=UPI00119D1061|nr:MULTISPECIES: Rho termination factor N-terminal domain-containing protein [Synechococcaceae]MCT0244829.1 hypothetical protein [Synechococcus sp. CS-601]MCT4365888.1 Rho termination factor N-terminal domain-containing protein [Candidatus Regnicoccus frigidus MAG-AL1]MCT4366677.1 Rho termination factor N-terminal domain-containing protein [Candidatus Regnicoccus frigidus MAG-AL2]